MTAPVVVVGGGLAGWRVADGVLQHAPGRRIVLIGGESRAPYDRPPLSKQALLGSRAYDDLVLPASTESDRLVLRLGHQVVSGGPGHVELLSGEHVEASDVVWATGVQPVRPGWAPRLPNVHVLRTVEDSQRISDTLTEGSSLVIIGGGFIGCEVAATAVLRGVKVTIVEMGSGLLGDAVHPDISRLVRSLHEDNGVRVCTEESVTAIEAAGSELVVQTDAGAHRADTVLVAVGARVDAGPLEGLPLDQGGIACDERGRVDGAEGVWAAGDVAAWRDPVLGERRRREHWTTAATHASIVSLGIAGADVPDALLCQPPYVWSDQYYMKVQVLGWPEAADHSEWLERDGPTGAVGYFSGDELVATMTVGAPRLLVKRRGAIGDYAARQLSATPT